MKGAIVLALAAGALLAACTGPGTGDGGKAGPAAVAGSCVETYSLSALTHREYAFDGVVTAIEPPEKGPEADSSDPSSVTFRVMRWYRGDRGSTVTLKTSVPLGTVTSIDFPAVREDGRYLVSGQGGFMWACGFTREWSEGEANAWRDALSG